MANNLKPSWRTTVYGILGAIGVLATQLGFLLDNDPATNPDWSLIWLALAALGGLVAARDKVV